MDFSDALHQIKRGKKLQRSGWNGKGLYVYLVPGSTFKVDADRPIGKTRPELVGTNVNYLPHIDMHTAQGDFVPWLASQADLLADDWQILE